MYKMNEKIKRQYFCGRLMNVLEANTNATVDKTKYPYNTLISKVIIYFSFCWRDIVFDTHCIVFYQ